MRSGALIELRENREQNKIRITKSPRFEGNPETGEPGQPSVKVGRSAGWGVNGKGEGEKDTGTLGVGIGVSGISAKGTVGNEAAHAEATVKALEAEAGVQLGEKGLQAGVGITLASVEVCGGTCINVGGGWSACGEVCGSAGVSVEAKVELTAEHAGTSLGVGILKASAGATLKPPVPLFKSEKFQQILRMVPQH